MLQKFKLRKSIQHILRFCVFSLCMSHTMVFAELINYSATCIDCAGEKGVDTGYDYTTVDLALDVNYWGRYDGYSFNSISYSGSNHLPSFTFDKDDRDVFELREFDYDISGSFFDIRGVWKENPFSTGSIVVRVLLDFKEDFWGIKTFDNQGQSFDSSVFHFDNYNGSHFDDFGDFTSTAGISAPTSTVNIPEPTSLAIFALGMIGLASRKYKLDSSRKHKLINH